MLKIFLSSTYQDLGEARSEILKKLDLAGNKLTNLPEAIKKLKERGVTVYLTKKEKEGPDYYYDITK